MEAFHSVSKQISDYLETAFEKNLVKNIEPAPELLSVSGGEVNQKEEETGRWHSTRLLEKHAS